jgi:hypothetical protein
MEHILAQISYSISQYERMNNIIPRIILIHF